MHLDQLLSDSVEVLLDGGFGRARHFGDLGVGEVVEVQEEEFLFVVGQLVDEVVERFASRVVVLAQGAEEPLVERHKLVPLFPLALAQLHAGGVEGYAVDPRGGVALAPEFRPSAPQVADDFLVEVVDIVRLPVGERKAYLVQDAARAAQHLLELYMSCLFSGHRIPSSVCVFLY